MSIHFSAGDLRRICETAAQVRQAIHDRSGAAKASVELPTDLQPEQIPVHLETSRPEHDRN